MSRNNPTAKSWYFFSLSLIYPTIEKIIADTTIGPAEKISAIDQLLKKKRLSQKLLQEDEQRLKSLKGVNQKVHDREGYYFAVEK